MDWSRVKTADKLDIQKLAPGVSAPMYEKKYIICDSENVLGNSDA